ncbi:hypothetical protein SELR_12830 [Selenomonas ruminantium subsp. lactilytica TAM6421]|uniref:Uncharacterized protein n=1 Tax=Selenomonas ruminantium subsp. lactilytica (strain NBRC 103574 / TAM6421) TaxID=927704 RepID=I0GQF4_SELRL|nr:hypothetical protein [Selenomonas ruminantium]BAL82991.1 hypothetical protein SELR_12830 [Selenomonas ruminantium subsp. lactilytica TAM6421]
MAMRYKERMQSIWKDGKLRNRQQILLMAIIVLLGVVMTAECKEYSAMEEKNVNMRREIVAYGELARKVNAAPCRAVQAEQVPQVMQDIVQKGKDYGLTIKVGDAPLYQDGTASIYELNITGTWKRTAMFLENLQSKDALIGMQMLDFQGTDEKLDTVVQIKIYTK